MTTITKENLTSFMEYYHNFHDSFITDIHYDIKGDKIEILVDVYWSGMPSLKESGEYETNKTKMKIVFHEIEKYQNKEIFTWDYIRKISIQFIQIRNKEYLCFASDDETPFFYVLCTRMEYEEVKL